MNIQRVKQGANITYFNGFYMILLGLYLLSFYDFNMKKSFVKIDQLWGFFSRYNPEIAFLFFLSNLLIGALLISNGIVIIFLSDFIIKRKDKMAWVVLFISGIISWAGLLTITFLIKNILLLFLSFFGWLTFIVGMLLPISYYLQKTYREY